MKPELSSLVDRILPYFTVDNVINSATSHMRLGRYEYSCLYYNTHTGMPPMLVHGDLWIANILWDKNKDGHAADTVASIIDWQSASAGNPLGDIARFLWSSVEGHVRRQHLSAFLDRYYNKLTEYYRQPLPFDRATVDKAYEGSLGFVMMFTVFGFPMWATIEAIVGKKDDSQHERRVKALMDRAKMVMEDYLAIVE
jgi:aminoglycoside phosphotransferase (APT) family kinase protein